MQLKTLLPSLLLLALRSEYAFAASDDVKASIPGAEPLLAKALSVKVSKRSLLMRPHYIATPLEYTGLLSKRQETCPGDLVTCTVFAGCCPAKTVCGVYGGEKGCCPEGERCSGVSGCSKDWVDCGNEVCCLPGSVCTKDTLGKTACGKGDDDNTGDDDDDNTGDDGCPSGYSSCSIFDGCCPTGAECVLPSNCKIPCSPSDPKCGTGCCTGGSVCRNDRCVLIDTEPDFTDLPGPSTTSTTIRRITITTTTSTVEDPETTEDEETTTTEESSTETTSTSSRDVFGNDNEEDATTTTTDAPTISRVSIRTTSTTTDNDNAAPTMGSLIGNGLGVAAGLIGALVL